MRIEKMILGNRIFSQLLLGALIILAASSQTFGDRGGNESGTDGNTSRSLPDFCEDIVYNICYSNASSWKDNVILTETIVTHAMKFLEDNEPLEFQEFENLRLSCENNERKINIDSIKELYKEMGGIPILQKTWDPESFDLEKALGLLLSYKIPVFAWVYKEKEVGSNDSKTIAHLDYISVYKHVTPSIQNEDFNRNMLIGWLKIFREESSYSDTVGFPEEAEALLKLNLDLAELEDNDHRSNHVKMRFSELHTFPEIQNDHCHSNSTCKARKISWDKVFSHFFEKIGYNMSEDDEIMIRKKRYFKNLETLLQNKTDRDIANFVGWAAVQKFVPAIPKSFALGYATKFVKGNETIFEFANIDCKSLHRDVSLVSTLRWFITVVDLATVKNQYWQICNTIKFAVYEIISNSEATKHRVDLKDLTEFIHSIECEIGYPKWIWEEQTMTFNATDLSGNLKKWWRTIQKRHWAHDFLEPIDENNEISLGKIKNHWEEKYGPAGNSIDIPFQFLIPPLKQSSVMTNYYVVGSEMAFKILKLLGDRERIQNVATENRIFRDVKETISECGSENRCFDDRTSFYRINSLDVATYAYELQYHYEAFQKINATNSSNYYATLPWPTKIEQQNAIYQYVEAHCPSHLGSDWCQVDNSTGRVNQMNLILKSSQVFKSAFECGSNTTLYSEKSCSYFNKFAYYTEP